jgi:hypothetical protein
MIVALIEKEMRQHGAMLFLFWAFIGAGFYFLKSNEILASVGGSGFYLVAWIHFVLFPLACLVLGNALIATEFRQKTQIFLDGLPLPRWKMVAVKYCCGLVAAQLTALMPLAVAIGIAWNEEAMDATFVILLVVKTSFWAWFCWAAIFPFSLLGRYRLIVGLIVVMGLMFAQNLGEVPVDRFGPFELIGERFAYERSEFPVLALSITAGLIVLLTVAGFAMSLVRDATLAAMLSEKMSSREKMAMFALGLTGLMIGGSLIERVTETAPLHLPDSMDVVDARVSVSVAAAVALPTEAEREAMQRHSKFAAQLVGEVAAFLSIEKMPKLFLVHRRDLSSAEFQDGELDSRQGCLVRLNLLKTPPSDMTYQSHLIEKLLNVNQHYRLNSDTRGWILEGFAYWWPRRKLGELPAATDLQEPSGKPMVFAQHDMTNITEYDIVHWKKFRQSLTEGTASEFAGQNIEALWARNEIACHEFLKATLGYTAPHDVRATLHDWWYNVPSLVGKLLRMDLKELAVSWNRAVSFGPQRQESPPQ